MIRRLRRRHRWMLAVVTLVVVPLFLAALGARPDRVFEEPPIALMPPEGDLESGVLVLYSLGHGEEVARVEWPGEDSP
ncbi:MAG: hypothetical protein GY769_15540 [bacterium]|nr:hypothetical protein [bacterium]